MLRNTAFKLDIKTEYKPCKRAGGLTMLQRSHISTTGCGTPPGAWSQGGNRESVTRNAYPCNAGENRHVVIAGLTGGIASGKSTVAAVLAEAGARIIDADRIARDIVRRGSAAHQRIVARFGRHILQPDGEIDRGRLGVIVFEDPQKREALEEIVHPGVREETARRLEQLRREEPGAVVILDVPLLFESGMHQGLAEVIVVYVPEAVQLERLMKRDRLPQAAALARIRSQMPLDAKRSLATRLIDNSGTPAQTRRQALEIYRQLSEQA